MDPFLRSAVTLPHQISQGQGQGQGQGQDQGQGYRFDLGSRSGMCYRVRSLD